MVSVMLVLLSKFTMAPFLDKQQSSQRISKLPAPKVACIFKIFKGQSCLTFTKEFDQIKKIKRKSKDIST